MLLKEFAMESNLEWKQWGRDDPLWAAATWRNKRKEGAAPWTDEEFYALGESDWRDFFQQWRQYGVSTESCLEIGCGPGRITRQLARCFASVCAVDVSEDMISYARKHAQALNTSFLVVEGVALPRPDRSVKSIFSTHVLQHLDSVEAGLAYFQEFYRVLDHGGTIFVHLPLYQFPAEHRAIGRVYSASWTMWKRLGKLRARVKRRLLLKTMRDTPYPPKVLYAFLAGLGFGRIEFRIFPVSSNGDLHPFVLATK
jgi:ubiquinone/menaquinone biosynthesis C-methylase UbiE